tara:strand:- start:824 stop:1537 length:714 start_codon:yes stop_codon:yes gene_type:complete
MARINSGPASSFFFNYDQNIVGDLEHDTEYADENNSEFIWPEGQLRINSARWMDTELGFNTPERPIFLEVFNGKTIENHVINFKTPDEITDDYLNSPLNKAFCESAFNDVAIIDRETERYITAVEDTTEAFTAFRASFDPILEREFIEWKEAKKQGEVSTNFVESDEPESSPRSVWELLSEATTEDLFKFKLDIFEQEVVQNSENRELRSKIRKAKSICEVCAAYQQLLDEETGSPE